MSPKELAHEVLKTSLLDRWFRARPEEVHLAPETTFRLSEDTYLEPDVVIYPRSTGIRGLSANNVSLGPRSPTPRSATTSDVRRRFAPASAFASFGSLTRFD
jgi:hypothetical protein